MDTASERTSTPDAGPDPAWTPRQRQVLDLIIRGKTNPEIAETLGISLDGAKWHMREILSKLGVNTREEAAEYWRRHNGLPARLARTFRAAIAPSALKWVGGSMAVVITIAVLAILVAARAPSDDRDSVADSADDASATFPGAATPTLESIGGVVVHRLEEGEPLPLPPDIAVYYIPAGYGKDAVLPDLRRVSRRSNGPLMEERLFEGALENAYTMALDLESGLIGVGVCEGQEAGVNCGTPSYEPMGDARPVGYISNDAGATYTRLGDLPHGAWVHAVVGDQLLIGLWHQGGLPARFEYFPSGTPAQSPVADAIPIRVDTGLVWMTDDGSLYRPNGSLLRKPQTFGQRAAIPESLTRPLSLQTWSTIVSGGPGNDTSTFYIGRFDSTGQLLAAFSWPAHIDPVVEIADDLLIGNYAPLDNLGLAFPAMVVSLTTGKIHPIQEFADAERQAGRILAVRPISQ